MTQEIADMEEEGNFFDFW